MKSKRGKLWFIGVALKIKKKMPKNKNGKSSAAGFEMNSDIMQMMGGFTVLRLTSMMGMLNISFSKEELLKMNKKLNRIKKPKNV